MGAAPNAKLSVEEYLALDRVAEVKSEYHDGEMFPLVAVTWSHGLLSTQATVLLKPQLSKKGCALQGSGVRVRVSPTKFVIPDLLVVCGKPEFTDD